MLSEQSQVLIASLFIRSVQWSSWGTCTMVKASVCVCCPGLYCPRVETPEHGPNLSSLPEGRIHLFKKRLKNGVFPRGFAGGAPAGCLFTQRHFQRPTQCQSVSTSHDLLRGRKQVTRFGLASSSARWLTVSSGGRRARVRQCWGGVGRLGGINHLLTPQSGSERCEGSTAQETQLAFTAGPH